jgi:malic enzyme
MEILKNVIKKADIFIWVSWQENQLKKEYIKTMNDKPIIFALSNPWPEIHPKDAKEWWAFIIATWRSDFPNQLNNILVFPGFFRWILDNRITKITEQHKLNAAIALSEYVKNLDVNNIVPNPLDKNVWKVIAESLLK